MHIRSLRYQVVPYSVDPEPSGGRLGIAVRVTHHHLQRTPPFRLPVGELLDAIQSPQVESWSRWHSRMP
jgi:hypothetical protein